MIRLLFCAAVEVVTVSIVVNVDPLSSVDTAMVKEEPEGKYDCICASVYSFSASFTPSSNALDVYDQLMAVPLSVVPEFILYVNPDVSPAYHWLLIKQAHRNPPNEMEYMRHILYFVSKTNMVSGSVLAPVTSPR